MLGMNDEPGALYQALAPYIKPVLVSAELKAAEAGENLSWEYMFFVDVMGP